MCSQSGSNVESKSLTSWESQPFLSGRIPTVCQQFQLSQIDPIREARMVPDDIPADKARGVPQPAK
jgi:hypothetical protein